MIPKWLKHSNNNLFIVFDTYGSIIYANDLFKAFFLIQKDAEHITNVFTKEESNKLLSFAKCITSDTNKQVNFVSYDKKDNIFQWEFMFYDPHSIIGIGQKNNTASRTASFINVEHLIASFMDNSPASAWICDAEGRLLSMKKYYLAFVGLTTADIGKTLWELFPKHLADDYYRNNAVVLETYQVLKTEELSIDHLGRARNFLVYKFPLTTVDNKKLVGGWSIDITEKKIAEQKVFEHGIKIKELAFLQSHKVRKPLANMLELIEVLKTMEAKLFDEELKNALMYIQSSALELDNEIKRVIDKLQEE